MTSFQKHPSKASSERSYNTSRQGRNNPAANNMSKPQKWEYITVRQQLGFGGMNSGLFYILPDGTEKKFSGKDHEARNFHKLINHFGDQGYELVEATTMDTNVSIYQSIWVMKRQKSNP